MSRQPDAFDMNEAADRADPEDVTCMHCGAEGLFWRKVTSPDGRTERSVLFEDGMRRHVCKPNADDFGVLA